MIASSMLFVDRRVEKHKTFQNRDEERKEKMTSRESRSISNRTLFDIYIYSTGQNYKNRPFFSVFLAFSYIFFRAMTNCKSKRMQFSVIFPMV